MTPPPRYVPLLHRVAGLNVLLLLAAVVVTAIVLAPGKISTFALDEEVIVVAVAVAVVVAANVLVLRRLVGPVQTLTALARRVDLTTPGQRMPAGKPTSEAGELALTFNEMLSRLEDERRQATGRVLAAQEAERLRIAQELHDQVGQELTAVLLGLSRLHARVPEELESEVLLVQDVVRASLDDLRRLAIELRPEALDELGLASALAVLTERFSDHLEVATVIATDLPDLPQEVELVVYRVAQEALTNVARHSGARVAALSLRGDADWLRLTVRDGGRGLTPAAAEGTGIRGMRERANLVGARLEIRDRAPEKGCEVLLHVPLPMASGYRQPSGHKDGVQPGRLA